MGPPPQNPRLVRNMSMPTLHPGNSTASGPGFTRVSSFSRLPNAAVLTPPYHPTVEHLLPPHVIPDQDPNLAVVPQLEPQEPLSPRAIPPSSAAVTVGTAATITPTISQPEHNLPPIHRHPHHLLHRHPNSPSPRSRPTQQRTHRISPLALTSFASVEPLPGIQGPTRSLADPSFVPEPTATHCEDSETESDEEHNRIPHNRPNAATRTVETLPFVPSPAATASTAAARPRSWAVALVHVLSMLGVPDAPIRPLERYAYLLIGALAYMSVVPALAMAAAVASLPPEFLRADDTGRSLLLPAVALLAVPSVARTSRSVPFAVSLFVAAMLLVVVTAADVCASPVVLVWASIVPLAAFSTLSTSGVFLASAAAAVAVFAADTRGNIVAATGMSLGMHTVSVPVVTPYFASPSFVIAGWVIFLGVFGVIQRQIHAVVSSVRDSSIMNMKEQFQNPYEFQAVGSNGDRTSDTSFVGGLIPSPRAARVLDGARDRRHLYSESCNCDSD